MTRAANFASSSEADGIRSALHHQLNHAQPDLAGLREAVCAFVAMLRDGGVPPERTLVAVKEVIASLHVAPNHAERLREVAGVITTWCVEEYYGAPGSG
jgi:hypothetical protein